MTDVVIAPSPIWRCPTAPALDRLAYRVADAAWLLSVSRSTLYELIAAGELRTIKVGKATLIPRAELLAWLERRQA